MTDQPTSPCRARLARRDRAAAQGAQRGDPRALLPEARVAGHRRFRRRQPRTVAQGGRDRRRGDRVLRGQVHGRHRQDPQPRQDRRAARHGRRLQSRGFVPARKIPRVPQGASRSHRADVYQLLDRSEGAVRRDRDLFQRRDDPGADPPGAADHLRSRPAPGRLSQPQVRSRDAAVAGGCASSTRRSARPS